MPGAMKRQLPFPGKNEASNQDKDFSSSVKKKNHSTPTRKTANDVSCRTRRFKNGTKALREIRSLQRSTRLLIPKASFSRLVREIINQFSCQGLRIQPQALEALQEAAEMYMVQFFEDSLLCTLHAKRVTLRVQDCHLMRRLRGPSEVGNL
ncbi:histone H3.3-like [Thrips palmi]|uniref:Histone H3.3-like n=1 Tax=Thrips palmi TaxID=161013 RepID=A0A6P9AA03_THRPL|nr:histone H3.3-like [Thrips palmi]